MLSPFSWGALPTCPHHPSENSSSLSVAPIPSPPRAHPRRRCHSFSPAAVTLLSVSSPPWPRPPPSGHPVGHPPGPFVPAAAAPPGGPRLAAGSRGPAPPTVGTGLPAAGQRGERTARLAHFRVGAASGLGVRPAAPGACSPAPRADPSQVFPRLALRERGAGLSAAWPEVSPAQPPAESCRRAARPPSGPAPGLASVPRRPCIPAVLVKGVRRIYRGRFKAKAPLRGLSQKCFHWQTIQAAPNSARYKVASLLPDNPSAKGRPPVGGLPGPTFNRCFLSFGKKWACPVPVL